ncbi:MAG: fatty-acid peroxygenase [Moraxellaceae bacterium]|jgi:fatty-acid peroxygenase|nr:fatty-acid peroxygenase [Moraxellaceae bacterium]
MAMNLLQLRPPTPAMTLLLTLAESLLDRTHAPVAIGRRLPTVPDSTLALLRDPYRFVNRTCSRLGRDFFQSRIFLRRTLFLRGQDAAELIYNGELFQRAGAAPLRLQRTLFGRGGVQTLDGQAHRRRKAMFMSVLGSPQNVRALNRLVGRELAATAQGWAENGDVDFYGELRTVLTRAVCDWAGLPLDEDEVALRTEQLTALFDQARLFGPPHWRAWTMRKAAERWCGQLVESVREEALEAAEDSALFAVSWQREADGGLLDAHDAAVELLNFLRPVVAVSVYAVFIAIALERWPECRERLREDDDLYLHAFVQEVRRFFPFFPMVAARSRRSIDWKGFRIPSGARVMLDLYATNHDPKLWQAPDTFYPERFFRQEPGAYSFVPQGGGDAHVHHRCPGENLTLDLMKTVASFLARDVRYELAKQDRRLDWQHLPPLSRPVCILEDVQFTKAAAALPAQASGRQKPVAH